jgi:hypothetical protein
MLKGSNNSQVPDTILAVHESFRRISNQDTNLEETFGELLEIP